MSGKTAIPTPAATSTQRFTRMDAMRGLAIVLVILRHGSTTLIEVEIFAPIWFQMTEDLPVPFRIPALVLLSGLLVDRAMKKSWREYTVGNPECPVALPDPGRDFPGYQRRRRTLSGTDGLGGHLVPVVHLFPDDLLCGDQFLRFLPASVPVLAARVEACFWPSSESLQGEILYFAGWFFLGQWTSRHWDVVDRLLHPVATAVAELAALVFAYFSLIWHVGHIPIMLLTRRVLTIAGVESFWIHDGAAHPHTGGAPRHRRGVIRKLHRGHGCAVVC